MTEIEKELRRACTERALALAPWVLAIFRVDVEGVVVPDHLIAAAAEEGSPILGLNIGYHMAVPVKELDVNAVGISGVFSFGRVPGFCGLPWESLVQIILMDGEKSYGAVSFSVAQGDSPSAAPDPAPAGKRHLKLVS